VAGGDGVKDLAWFHPAGRELSSTDWFDHGLRSAGMYLDGRGLRHRGSRGEVITDDSYLLLLHAGDRDEKFTLPDQPWGGSYRMVIDTTYPGGQPQRTDLLLGGSALHVPGRTTMLLRVERG
jgi:glycogen operon protein